MSPVAKVATLVVVIVAVGVPVGLLLGPYTPLVMVPFGGGLGFWIGTR